VSEYQYYEFVALDRPLTVAEMAELRSISTRAQITPTRFFNEYQWGDLKADPAELLARYFDVHVYFANWGTRRLMFRLPLHAVHLDDLRACVPGGPVTLTVTEHHVVLDLWSETEEPEEDWFEDGQLLASLTPLRAELLRGDRRVAYLAWLLALQAGELYPNTLEPRVPHGLDADSASLAALTGFLRVDPDLLAAAAEAGVEDTGELERFRSWVARTPSSASWRSGSDMHASCQPMSALGGRTASAMRPAGSSPPSSTSMIAWSRGRSAMTRWVTSSPANRAAATPSTVWLAATIASRAALACSPLPIRAP
jgi:hypothetical protein